MIRCRGALSLVMSPAIERDVLAELSTAMVAYLKNMAAMGTCLEQAWPEIGLTYNKRIQGLHSRLSFEVTREAIRESSELLQAELKDYAEVVHRLQSERSIDMERGLLALREMNEAIAKLEEQGVAKAMEKKGQIKGEIVVLLKTEEEFPVRYGI